MADDAAMKITTLPPAGDVKNKRIGERLVEQGLVTADQLRVALHEKQRSSKMLGEILVEMNYVRPSQVQEALAYQKRTKK